MKIFGAILLKIAATYKNSSKPHRYLKGYMYNIEWKYTGSMYFNRFFYVIYVHKLRNSAAFENSQ